MALDEYEIHGISLHNLGTNLPLFFDANPGKDLDQTYIFKQIGAKNLILSSRRNFVDRFDEN